MTRAEVSAPDVSEGVFPVDDVDFRLSTAGWPALDVDMATRIDAHWQRAVAAKPGLWNGPVMAVLAPGRPDGLRLANGVLSGSVVTGEFKSLLAWCDWDMPEIGIRNLFGSALILSADGALIFGKMAANTAWGGWIYPPGGGIEIGDVSADGRIDLVRSTANELVEETGLLIDDARVSGRLACMAGGRVSIGHVLHFPDVANVLAERIRTFVGSQPHPELEDIVIVRRPADLDSRPKVMTFARLYAEYLLGS